MSFEELESRERFYKKMLWVVNGEKFKKNFHILGKLPNPNDHRFADIAFQPIKKNQLGRSFFKYSENPDLEDAWDEIRIVRMHPYGEIAKEVEQSYHGHHLFDWVRMREIWIHSTCDVFIDFGEQVIWKLMEYDKKGLHCVRSINKDYFIKRAIGGTSMASK